MKGKTGQSFEEKVLNYPPLKEFAGKFSASVLNSVKKGVIPWVKVESLSSAPDFLLDLVSETVKRKVSGIVVKGELDEGVLKKVKEWRNLAVLKIEIKLGDTFKEVKESLKSSALEFQKKIWAEGEYSIIGDVVTLWPLGFDLPVRVLFEKDVVSKISIVDIQNRRSIKEIDVLSWNKYEEDSDISDIVVSGEEHAVNLDLPVVFSQTVPVEDEINFKIDPYILNMVQSEWDEEVVSKYINEGWQIYFVINHNIEKAQKIREEYPSIEIFEEELSSGFCFRDIKLLVLTDQELWGTIKLEQGTSRNRFSDLVLEEVSPGDYVVHEDHGIALYTGIKKDEKNADIKYMELKYAEKDRLLVPLSQVKKINKYVGIGRGVPKLTRLSSGEWKRIKKRVKESVRKLASELLRLYAARELTKVDPLKFSASSLPKFENDFEFVETEDQLQSIEDIKHDLADTKPMDRVLVGDVGFGKTEVAMRAAFLMVENGKQVAVLAPTTVLVEQHFSVFKNRMEKYGIRVEELSRFVEKSKAEEVIDALAKGNVDIVIGTHRLLGKSIKFKNLGLVVIDEEQKFGVAQKEKLKGMRIDAHVLSMSATPIPRTLNMALSGVRDISVIAVPPEGRKPVKNLVKRFDWDIVAEAIKKEVDGGGQVYFVHNRVSSIVFIKEKLEDILPGVKFVVGHGQMPAENLAKVMRDFGARKYDVLICSTIIENGLDMPNVNTLIVDRAEMFGLAQLYQLRGRIGRSSKQAYAYFLYHGSGVDGWTKEEFLEREREFGEAEYLERSSERQGSGLHLPKKKMLWETARQRLNAIQELEELGSGFNLAQRDLEIRGAGNFLGREQHGNVALVGFSLYCRLLNEMVDEMKQTQKVGGDKLS